MEVAFQASCCTSPVYQLWFHGPGWHLDRRAILLPVGRLGLKDQHSAIHNLTNCVMPGGMKLLRILPIDASAPSHKATVCLTDHERYSLHGLHGSGTAATRTLTYARILRRAGASSEGVGWTDAEISGALEVSQSTMRRV